MAASASKNPPDKKEAPRLQLLLFEALEADCSNYMRWSINAKTHLIADELEGTLISPTPEHILIIAKCRALLLLRRHLNALL